MNKKASKFAFLNEYVIYNIMQISNTLNKVKNTSVQIFYIYVGNSEIESLHKEQQLLTENSELLKEDIVNLIKNHQHLDNKRYKLKSLLRYNINVEPSNVLHVLPHKEASFDPYLRNEKHLNTIKFEDTVYILQSMNAIFFVFSRDETKSSKQSPANTKRIIFNNTLRNSRLRKTKRRKLIKDMK